MKEIKSVLIVLVIGILLILLGLSYYVFNEGYKNGYQKATENLTQLNECEYKRNTCRYQLKDCWQFVNEREIK